MRLLAYDDLKPIKGISYSKTHLWRLEKIGTFPRRVPLGASRHGWIEKEIDAWLEQRVAERDATQAEAAA